MSRSPHRTIVPFCDRWADPEPHGAVFAGIRRTLCEPLELLDPSQQRIVLISDYIGEIGCGGHDQYFFNLHNDVAERVPATVESLRNLGLAQAADILSRAYERWSDRERPVLKNIEEVSEMFMEEEFDDLDDAFFELEQSDPGEHPSAVVEVYLAENEAMFVELTPPTAADQCLIDMGDLATHADGGRAAWLSLADHPSPRVRLQAAKSLLDKDFGRAAEIGMGVYTDPVTDDWVINHAAEFLRAAGVSHETMMAAQQRRHEARSRP